MKTRSLPKENKKQINHDGYGKEIPPCLFHVTVWFVQQGHTELEAKSFYSYYDFRGWINKQGMVLKDWKMTAWEWIWNHKKSGN